MDEFQINSEEVIGDEFYEKIEAPKFVDLAAPDRFRTENDDRYWFCHRVGCDQKHEEEMDSEAIYKKIVLRVMAARSPSVGLRKALNSRSKLECPRTVPAKSSKSRVSKLAMISSISQNMGEAKVKVKHVPKQCSTTPDVKTAKKSCTKALTTPRNKKGISNPGTFRSVRNPKTTTIEVPRDRLVAKALVFHSPKKAVKLKKSVEWSSSLRKICKGVKKLEVSDGNKTNNKPLDAPRKQLRAREVKSRVYDSLHSQNQKTHEAKSVKRLKKRNSVKELPLSEAPMCHKPDETDLSETTSKKPSDRREQDMGENEINERSIHEATENDDKENALAGEEIDNKENAAASDENRKLDCVTGKLVKKDVLWRHETSKNIQKVTEVMNKTMKENSTAEKGMKYRKPKPTNPKPFRLRTDERGILKEANLEKKHLQAPLKETTTFHGSHIGNSLKKHQNVEANENCLGQIKTSNCAHEDSEEPVTRTLEHQNVEANENCLGQIKTSNCAHEDSEEPVTRTLEDQPQCIKRSSSRASTTPQKCVVPMHQKMTVTSLMKKGQDKAAQSSEGGRLEKSKSPIIKQLVRPRGGASSRKELVSVKPGQLDAIKEMSHTMAKETSDHNERGCGTSLMKKATSQRRRHTTIPKEPNFHRASTTPQKCAVPMHQKMTVTSLMKKGQDKAAQSSEGDRLEKSKSPIIKQLVRQRGGASSRKELVSVKPGQLDAIKEMSPTMAKETSDHCCGNNSAKRHT